MTDKSIKDQLSTKECIRFQLDCWNRICKFHMALPKDNFKSILDLSAVPLLKDPLNIKTIVEIEQLRS